MRKLRILSFLLAVLLCFASCDSGTEIVETTESIPTIEISEDGIPTPGVIDLSAFSDALGDEDRLTLTHTYAFQPLPELEKDWEYNRLRINTYNGMLCVDIEKQGERLSVLERQVAVLDPDDGIVKTVPYTKPTVDYYDDEALLELIRGTRIIDENTFLHTSYTNVVGYTPDREDELESGYLMLCDASGNVLDDSIIPGVGQNGHFVMLPDGKIAVLGGESVCIYDAELNLIGQIEGSVKTSLFTTPKGELLADGLYLGTYLRVDTDRLTSETETHYDNPDNVKGLTMMYFSSKESAYEVYYANETGFWGYNVGDAEAELLCSWHNSGQVYSNLTILGIHDADHILVSVKDPFTYTDSIGWLCRNPDVQTSNKIPIRLGLIDNLFRFGYGNHKTIIENAVNHFNAHNSEYFVEIVDYSNERDEHGEIPQAFTEAMLADEAADILINTRYIRDALRIYTTKNAFVDLQDAFGDVLLPCVHSAYDDRYGALYSIPINMYLSMPVCLETTLSSDTPLTLDVMYDLAEQAEQSGTYLFNLNGTINFDSLTDRIFAAAVPSFANKETGECFYDGEEFGKLLAFLETVSDRVAGNETRFSYEYSDYVLESDAIFDALQSGDVTFLEFPFFTIDAYAILKQLYGDSDFVLHGYPSRDREIVRFRSDIDISLNAASKVKLGAAQFLAYLLSDTIQLYSANSSLPVTISAVESLLASPTFVYAPGSMYRLDLVYDEEVLETVYWDALRITYDENDLAAIRHLLYETETSADLDATVQSIIQEELSAYRAGIRSLEETQNILQSRLWIYINE